METALNLHATGSAIATNIFRNRGITEPQIYNITTSLKIKVI